MLAMSDGLIRHNAGTSPPFIEVTTRAGLTKHHDEDLPEHKKYHGDFKPLPPRSPLQAKRERQLASSLIGRNPAKCVGLCRETHLGQQRSADALLDHAWTFRSPVDQIYHDNPTA